MSTNQNQEEPQEPIGGGGGLPYPSRSKQYGKFPGLTYRQTYRVIITMPTVQLAICFVSFLLTWSEIYEISYAPLLQVSGFSLMTSIYMWYMAKLSGSCGGALLSIYTMILLNIFNIVHLITPVGYYLLYGTVITGLGLIFSLVFFKNGFERKRK
ncbi:MAG: hypothetical protein AAF934_03525 [Bacteroidota bacterium]